MASDHVDNIPDSIGIWVEDVDAKKAVIEFDEFHKSRLGPGESYSRSQKVRDAMAFYLDIMQVLEEFDMADRSERGKSHAVRSMLREHLSE